MKIVFFAESLRSGGKERRILELLTYLKKNTDYDLYLVITRKEVHYKEFYKLSIPLMIIKRKSKKDPRLFYKFWSICKSINPSIIHSWGSMVSFYSIPAATLLNIPIINNEITRAPAQISRYTFNYFISKINFFFSYKILSNSYEGLKVYNIHSNRSEVIYNGIDLSRFHNLAPKDQTKKRFNICTDLVIGMVASFSKKKNYGLYFDAAEIVLKLRNDVTFLAVGGADGSDSTLDYFKEKYKNNDRIIITGPINSELESIVNICDIGVLLTNRKNHGEGISNAIIEFFALRKPVIANNTGGTKEIIDNNYNGILLQNDSKEYIAKNMVTLLGNKKLIESLGENGYKTIRTKFTINSMGESYIDIYKTFM